MVHDHDSSAAAQLLCDCVSHSLQCKSNNDYLYAGCSELVSQLLKDTQPASQLEMVPGIDRRVPRTGGRRLPIQHVLCLLVRQLILRPTSHASLDLVTVIPQCNISIRQLAFARHEHWCICKQFGCLLSPDLS